MLQRRSYLPSIPTFEELTLISGNSGNPTFHARFSPTTTDIRICTGTRIAAIPSQNSETNSSVVFLFVRHTRLVVVVGLPRLYRRRRSRSKLNSPARVAPNDSSSAVRFEGRVRVVVDRCRRSPWNCIPGKLYGSFGNFRLRDLDPRW